MLAKEDGLLDFSQPAEVLERRVRAFSPWPGAYLILQGQPLKIHRARAAGCGEQIPGTHCELDGLPAVAAARGCLVLEEVQPAGKRPMNGHDFLRGFRQWRAG
jgi:methionyl-tRNA formyltransferase